MSTLDPERTAEGAIARPSGPAREPLRHQPDRADRKPPWLRVRLSQSPRYHEVRELVRAAGLNTVCESASCPNIGECWSHRALTFMILGNVCTRSCGFCDVATGRPGVVDADEPRRVAEALAQLSLRYAVITSVDRDDLDDGGAAIWAETIGRLRTSCPELKIEVLTPDFKGEMAHVDVVLNAKPHVFAHNLETVERLHRDVRPQARYARSLAVLEHARQGEAVSKSGLMIGLGERFDEVVATMKDLAGVGVQLLSLGQYLRPSPRHLPVDRWVTPEEFAALKEVGEGMGIGHVESGPLVRSSYRADRQAAGLLASQPTREEPSLKEDDAVDELDLVALAAGTPTS